MAKLPALKDWKTSVEEQLKKIAYTETDILKIIYLCQDYLGESQPIGQWIGQQQSYLNQMYRNFSDMYITRFGKQPPPRPKEESVPEVLLDSPERRKQEIRDVALSITKPGNNVSDEAVLEELKRCGMKIDAANPTATISTILHGFKLQFEKVQGKRGVFRRRE